MSLAHFPYTLEYIYVYIYVYVNYPWKDTGLMGCHCTVMSVMIASIISHRTRRSVWGDGSTFTPPERIDTHAGITWWGLRRTHLLTLAPIGFFRRAL